MKAGARGDPHLKTVDGLEYSFNGVGEFHFILSKNASFESQIRFERAKNTQGNGVTYLLIICCFSVFLFCMCTNNSFPLQVI